MHDRDREKVTVAYSSLRSSSVNEEMQIFLDETSSQSSTKQLKKDSNIRFLSIPPLKSQHYHNVQHLF